jgi:hypothetical protein
MVYDSRDDPALVLDAIAYVEEVHKALRTENTAPPPGVEGRVVAAILADSDLAAYVRDWAESRHALEASPEPPVLPPIDKSYQRVRELLVAAEAAGSG